MGKSISLRYTLTHKPTTLMSLLMFHSGNVPLTENGMKIKVLGIQKIYTTEFKCVTPEPDGIVNMVDELLSGTIDWIQLRMYESMHKDRAISEKVYTDVLPAMLVDHFRGIVTLYLGDTSFTSDDGSKKLVSITLSNTPSVCTFNTIDS